MTGSAAVADDDEQGTIEAEPMTSRLGVPAVEAIPITVRIRIGGPAGRTEQQILQLRPRVEEPKEKSSPVTAN